MSDPVLTVAVSTLAKNRDQLLARLSAIKADLPPAIKFLVVSQLEADEGYFCFDGIDVYKSEEKGLSKSRNLGLSRCVTDWIWFQDDDIDILVGPLLTLAKKIGGFGCDVILAKVASREKPGEYFKNYDRYSINKRFLALRISSIEIIANVPFLRRYDLRFDDNLGLGSALPSCEENLFFYDCIVKSSGSFMVYDDAISLHTTVSESRNIDYEGRYRARGYMLAKMGDFFSPIILIWWAVRRTRENLPRRVRLSLMLRSYFQTRAHQINSDKV